MARQVPVGYSRDVSPLPVVVHLALHANIVLIPQGYRGHPCLTLVVDDELVRQPDFVSTHVIGCRRCPSLSRASIQNHARRQMHETREQTIVYVLRPREKTVICSSPQHPPQATFTVLWEPLPLFSPSLSLTRIYHQLRFKVTCRHRIPCPPNYMPKL